jgi:opacity protein-like surface antigen
MGRRRFQLAAVIAAVGFAAPLAALGFAAPLAAQIPEQQSPARMRAGGGVALARPVGDFGEVVDVGVGLGGHFLLYITPGGALSLRADAGFLNYGNETQRVCLSTTVGCRITVDLTTSNNIVYGHIGPQLMVPGGPVRPYVNGGVGFSYFATTSSVEGSTNSEPFASTTNFDDGAFSWGAGGGIYIPLPISATADIALDLGARYSATREIEYLREGDINDRPDGSIEFTPRRSDANLVTFILGVSVAF